MANLTLSNSFTGTAGARNGNTQISKTVDLTLCSDAIIGIGNGIKSYDEFLSKELKKNGKKQEVKIKLKKLKESLSKEYSNIGGIDPIKYLAKLYYEDGFSTEVILKRLKNKGLNYSSGRGLRALFTDTFGWTIRDKTDITEIQMKQKSVAPQVAILKASNDAIIKNNRELFNARLGKILGSTEKEKIFSIDFYNQLSGKKGEKMNKVWYLLECFEGISGEMIIDIIENTDLGPRGIARIINEKIDVIKEKINISDKLGVSDKNISDYFKREKAN